MKNPIPLYKAERTLCCVFGCNSKLQFKSYDDTRFHNIPFDRSRVLLSKWVNAIKLPRRICSHMIVCSKHFISDDYFNYDGGKELKPDAVPSQNLPLVWRNKFVPRDYGRLIKIMEVRGIGRLRLCFESKLARQISKANLKRRERRKKRKEALMGKSPIVKEKQQNEQSTDSQTNNAAVNNQHNSGEEINKEGESEQSQDHDHEKIGETNEEHSLTSEFFIKEEPISDTEEADDAVEEMFAKMTEESEDMHVTQVENVNKPWDFEENIEWIHLFCNICGEDDCGGHEEEKFECVPCNKQFKTGRQLNAHNLSHFEYRRRGHMLEKEPICKVCNKAIPSKVSLNEHMLSHSNDKQHVCMLCDKVFRNKAHLVMHINSHTIHPNHRCKMCGQCFMDGTELDRHVKKHKVKTREYTCRECGNRFKSQQACWAHLNSHMRAKSRPGLSCDVCGRVLSTRATLKEHMFIHSGEKPFECQLCGRKIRHRANFIIHVQGHSLGQPHLCSLCGMGFSKKTELSSHLAAEHPEDKPFLCIICGMRFRTETRFHRHAVSHDAYLEEET